MKKLLIGFIAVFGITAAGMFASVANAETTSVRIATVTAVQPVYTSSYVNQPTNRCNIVQVPVYGNRGGASGLEVLGGAIIGGLIGKGVTDTDEGAVVGGVIGGVAAAEAGRGRVVIGYRNERRCEVVDNWIAQNTVSHYNVTYTWRNLVSTSATTVPYSVGDNINVNVTIGLNGE